MTNEDIIREFSALPPEARREVENFIAFLRARYDKEIKPEQKGNLQEESFIGMWKDRKDLCDAAGFVRELREAE